MVEAARGGPTGSGQERAPRSSIYDAWPFWPPPKEQEIFGMDLSARGLRNLYEAVQQTGDGDGLTNLLERWSFDLHAAFKAHAWVSYEFAERMMALTVHYGGPHVLQRAAQMMFDPGTLGPAYPLFRIAGRPMNTLERIVASSPRFNKIQTFRLEKKSPRHARIYAKVCRPNLSPTTRHLCEILRAQMFAVPVFFRCQTRATHHTCILDGHEECVFDVTWDAPPTHRWSHLVGSAVGAASSFALGAAFGASQSMLTFSALLGGFAGFLVAFNFRQHRQLREQLHSVDLHGSALSESLETTEDRFAELLEAKRDVEAKVVQRTADLNERTAQLSQALNELRELNEAKTKFFSHISHELRTPLTLILGPLRALQATGLSSAQVQHHATTMSRNADQLLKMINELLDLARSEAGYATLSRQAVDVDELASNAAAAVVEHASARGLALSTELNAKVTCDLDARWLRRALDNLLANALGHARTQIVLRSRFESGALWFEVEDDGDGVEPELQSRIFDRYVRGDTERAGSGLGLAIVREAARLHGGDASLETPESGGALFRIQMPATLSDVSAVHTDALARPHTATESAERPGPYADAPAVLVVEDHDDLRDFMADILSTRFQVHTAASGLEGFKRAQALLPDVVVTDVAMDGIDGLELTRRLRAHNLTRDLPIIVVTARGEPDDAARGFEAGANDYVPKPFHVAELLARVDAQLKLRRGVARQVHHQRARAVSGITEAVVSRLANPIGVLLQVLPELERVAHADVPTRAVARLAQQATTEVCEIVQGMEKLTRPSDSCSVKTVVRNVAELFRAQHPGLSIELHELNDVQVAIDPVALTHALTYLLVELVTASEAPGTLRVSISADRDDDRATMRLTSNLPGAQWARPGSDPATRRARHDPNQHAAPQPPVELSMARELLDAHGGSLKVEEATAEGAFVIRLPLRSSKLSAAGAGKLAQPA